MNETIYYHISSYYFPCYFIIFYEFREKHYIIKLFIKHTCRTLNYWTSDTTKPKVSFVNIVWLFNVIICSKSIWRTFVERASPIICPVVLVDGFWILSLKKKQKTKQQWFTLQHRTTEMLEAIKTNNFSFL